LCYVRSRAESLNSSGKMPKVLFHQDSGPPLEQLLLESKVSICEVNL